MALNEKQERFAQAYILHRNARVATKAAGYNGNSDQAFDNQGHRLINNPEVKERIEELEGSLTTNVDVIAEIEAQYNSASRSKNTNSAIKALELLSKVRGVKDAKEKNTSTQSKKDNIVKNFKILGKEKVDEIYKLCGFK
jgi:phage terminase small subunit|tara:strand:+ start:196 stop:615 length:420 start_codon:yes stop_codon:yes gene_type:complete